jgi:putative endonuclease
MKIFTKKELGDFGEKLAKKYLCDKKLKFVEKNFRFYQNEIDLIFCDKKNEIIIFIEVKTRTSKAFGEPEEAINRRKQLFIRRAANGFLMINPKYRDFNIRFDSVSVFMGNEKPEINHIENSF